MGAVIIVAIGAYAVMRISNNQLAPNQIKAPSAVSGTNNLPITKAPAESSANISAEDPQDIVPGLYKNPIQNAAVEEGFVITDSKVENNTDKAGKAINDHLELTLKNVVGKDLTDFEAYYTITDTATGQKEGYYKKLANFVLKSGETQTIHFDNGTDPGHFKANKDSLYYKSSNKLTFDITVSAAGYKIQNVKISKDAGGAEQLD